MNLREKSINRLYLLLYNRGNIVGVSLIKNQHSSECLHLKSDAMQPEALRALNSPLV